MTRGGIKQLSFSHDGELLAFGGDDQSVYIVSYTHYPQNGPDPRYLSSAANSLSSTTLAQ